MRPGRMIAALAGLVEWSRRRAGWVVAAAAMASGALGWLVASRISIDTDTSRLLAPNSAWQRAGRELDREFPQNDGILAVVVDADTPDAAEDAAATLARAMGAQTDLFRDVRQPDAGAFFRKNGLLFLSREEVQDFSDHVIAAQPMLGTLAADPSARGVLDALGLFALGAVHGEVPASSLDAPFRTVSASLQAAGEGRIQPISWQSLLSDRKPLPRELRRFVLARPVLNFSGIEPGKRSVDFVHEAALQAGFEPGVRVRVTGSVALSDDQFAALREGAGLAAGAAGALLLFWLVAAVRSIRSAAAILITLLVGLVGSAGFAVGAVGPFNPISVAFGPLFIGIAIDFGIQLTVRYAAEVRSEEKDSALLRAARAVGLPLAVAAAATAAGFLSLYPTDYKGVSDLGLIAGVGMAIALGLNLTLLPALLALFRAPGFKEAAGPRWGARLDQGLVRHRFLVLGISAALALVSLAALARLRSDFDPIHLEDPRAESVRTLTDLMGSPDTTPYTLDVLAPSQALAAETARRLSTLPEVYRVLWIGSFVPSGQDEKLEIIRDARDLLEPTLSPVAVKPSPLDADILASASRCAEQLRILAKRGDGAAGQLASALDRLRAEGSLSDRLRGNLAGGIAGRLEDIRLALQAAPVSLDNMPADFRRDWVGADGRCRIEVFPKGDARDPAVLRRFAAAVRSVVPEATGTPVTIEESGKTVLGAFKTAGVLAVLAIGVLLALVLRRFADVAAVLLPLALAGLLTLGTSALLGMPVNFANIVTLPLLLGIGVAFDIYFVLRWRSGEPGLLGSPTARGVIFSALTTGTAFGSLAVSRSPGMADMGRLLSLGLLFTLVCTLFVLPALLGKAPAVAGKQEVG